MNSWRSTLAAAGVVQTFPNSITSVFDAIAIAHITGRLIKSPTKRVKNMTQDEIQQDLDDAWYYQEDEDERERKEAKDKLDVAEMRERERIDRVNAVNDEYGIKPGAGGSQVNPYINPKTSFSWYEWNWTIYIVCCMVYISSYLATLFLAWLLGTHNVFQSHQANDNAYSVGLWCIIITFFYGKIRQKM